MIFLLLPVLFLLSSVLVSGYVPSQRPRGDDDDDGLSHARRSDLSLDRGRCRCIPGDSCWPSSADWSSLNKTVHGRLISTVPIAHVCHVPHLEEDTCSSLRTNWGRPETHIFAPGDFVAPYFQNQSCDPFTSQGAPCELGNYPPYSINVTGADDIVAGLNFVRKHNIRLVIKNTGQDFLGKSSGKGALELWMANLKAASFIPHFGSRDYRGPAMKLSAGLVNSEAAAIAHRYNVRIVGGSSPTVGVAGGFTTGGGHSPLMGHYGLAADNVLEWEVVTPQGKHVVAKPQGKYADLYWALTGGGGSTWGVVLSMTAKVHPDGPVGGAQLIVPSQGLAPETYWGAVTAFHTFIPDFASDGTVATSLINNDALTMFAATSPDKTAAEVRAHLSPFIKQLDRQKIPYNVSYTSFDNYYDHLAHYLGPYPYGSFAVTQLTGGRLVPKSVLASRGATKRLVDTVRDVVANGHFYVTMETFDLDATATSRAAYHEGKNSATPRFRQSELYYIVIGEWDFAVPRSEMAARQDELTDAIMPALKAVTPGSGSYLNEANFADADWQESFYGVNYARLSQIKNKYDPDNLLYARTAVGSQKWREDEQGRICFAA
ncbi:hypothetical protein GGS20DRAFT_582494 [Poronia punctata]|nr:hypothetical protein GGS20DRAFT_582494 [Poronia punctata]